MNDLTITNKFIKEVMDECPEIINHKDANDAYVIMEKVKKDIINVPELADTYKKLGEGIEGYFARVNLFDDLFSVVIEFKKGENTVSTLKLTYGLGIAKFSGVPDIQINFKCPDTHVAVMLIKGYNEINASFENINIDEIKSITGLFRGYVMEYQVVEGVDNV